MPTDIQHFRRKYSDSAVVGGKGFVELRHLAANTRQTLNQMDLKAHFSQVQGRLDSRDAATDNKHVPIHNLPPVKAVNISISGSLCYFQRPQRLYYLGKLGRHFGKFGAFGRRYPLKAKPFRLYPQDIDQRFRRSEHFFSLYITFQVMTVADVSAGDQDTISTVLKSLENEIGIYPPGTHHPYDTKIWGILKPADAGQICRRIGAPVTGKCYYFRFEFP
jgi:hypothetical protein